MEDNFDGSWKPWYNEHERMDRQSSFSKHLEAFPESQAGELDGICPSHWLGGESGFAVDSSWPASPIAAVQFMKGGEK